MTEGYSEKEYPFAYIVSLLFSIELFGVTYEKEMDILFIIIVSA